MELQARAEEFARADTRIFAISYDPVEELAQFAGRQGITFSLLSDEGSVVITRLGLLNVYVAEQQAFAGRPVESHHTGIPYPGSFLLDENGVIADKRFEQTHQPRPAPDLILEEILGEASLEQTVVASAESSYARAVAWLSGATYRPMQRLRLHVRLEVGPDLHVYGTPAPGGTTPLGIEIEPQEGLVVEPAELPGVRRLAGAGEPMLGYVGAVAAAVPFQLEANQGEIELGVRLSFQACSDAICFAPENLRLALRLQGLDNLRPEPRA